MILNRTLTAAALALAFLAAPAVAQVITPAPGSGGGGTACTVATPCTVKQDIAPVSTSTGALILHMPASNTGDAVEIQNNGTTTMRWGGNGALWTREYRADIGRAIGWGTNPSVGIDRTALFGGGSSGCIAHLVVASDFNQTNYFILNPISPNGPMQVGDCDGTTPVARSMWVEGVASGNSNTAGQDFTFQASRGTGTGAGGSWVFKVAPAGTTGTAINAVVTALTINSAVHAVSGGTAPALTSCGTGPTITGTDTAGTITEGSSASGCVATFNKAWAAAPHCTVSEESGLGVSFSISTTALTLTNIGALSSTKIDYICIG